MNFTNILLSKRSQIQKNTRCDSIYINFKNRQKQAMMLEVRIQWLSWERGDQDAWWPRRDCLLEWNALLLGLRLRSLGEN